MHLLLPVDTFSEPMYQLKKKQKIENDKSSFYFCNVYVDKRQHLQFEHETWLLMAREKTDSLEVI